MKDIRMTIKKDDLIKMLNAYYSELLGEKVLINSQTETVWKGYGVSEHEEPEVNFSYTIDHNLGGAILRVNNTLDDNDLKVALNAILSKIGYSVESIEYKTTSGSFRDEGVYTFTGLEVKVNKKGMEMTLDK